MRPSFPSIGKPIQSQNTFRRSIFALLRRSIGQLRSHWPSFKPNRQTGRHSRVHSRTHAQSYLFSFLLSSTSFVCCILLSAIKDWFFRSFSLRARPLLTVSAFILFLFRPLTALPFVCSRRRRNIALHCYIRCNRCAFNSPPCRRSQQ